jgi:hypothetical protein
VLQLRTGLPSESTPVSASRLFGTEERPDVSAFKTPRRANKQPLRTCLTGFWMRFHPDKGISGLRLVEAVRVTQSTLADGPSEHRTISLDSC